MKYWQSSKRQRTCLQNVTQKHEVRFRYCMGNVEVTHASSHFNPLFLRMFPTVYM